MGKCQLFRTRWNFTQRKANKFWHNFSAWIEQIYKMVFLENKTFFQIRLVLIKTELHISCSNLPKQKSFIDKTAFPPHFSPQPSNLFISAISETFCNSSDRGWYNWLVEKGREGVPVSLFQSQLQHDQRQPLSPLLSFLSELLTFLPSHFLSYFHLLIFTCF